MKNLLKRLLPWFLVVISAGLTLAIAPQQNPLLLAIIIASLGFFPLEAGRLGWAWLKRRRAAAAARPRSGAIATDQPSRTYLVTGANRGLGLALVKQLRAQGHVVIGTTRSLDQAGELKALTDRVECLDIADPTSVRHLAQQLAGEPLDGIFNNGAKGPTAQGFAELDLDSLEQDFATNAVGPLRVVQALMENLKAGRDRLVVNISSDLGSFTITKPSLLYGYRASKAALNMLSKTAARELESQGIRWILIHPGSVQTRLNQKGLLSPEESAGAILATLNQLQPQQTGLWLDYQGQPVPW
ncbi:MAG: SDR family oxidoreductase [Synechococcales bacterium]|nr:SDR family oxidoreductase [Synechococcales bacterium]